MKYYNNLKVILISTLCIFAFGCAKKRFERGYTFRKPPVNVYKADKEISISGSVTAQIGLMYDEDVALSSFTVNAVNGKKYLVQLGPSWYVKMERFKLIVGDKVTIIGAPVEFNNPVENASDNKAEKEKFITFLARKVKKTAPYKSFISLRDEKGNPLWYGKGQAIGKQRYIEKMLKEGKPIRREYQKTPF